jgi:hypothetical protein
MSHAKTDVEKGNGPAVLDVIGVVAPENNVSHNYGVRLARYFF